MQWTKRTATVEDDSSQAGRFSAMGDVHDYQRYLGIQHARSRIQVSAIRMGNEICQQQADARGLEVVRPNVPIQRPG